uniref:Uncharacterized protein n=1 Tax=Anguilla anguilla TaxID=7936 RepID=A0A0E9QKN8_ANGAN
MQTNISEIFTSILFLKNCFDPEQIQTSL